MRVDHETVMPTKGDVVVRSLPSWLMRLVAPVTAVLIVGAGAAAATGATEPTPPNTIQPTTSAPIDPTNPPESPQQGRGQGPPLTLTPSPLKTPTTPPTTVPPDSGDTKKAGKPLVACGDARNHGEYVSSVAHLAPAGEPRGQAVREAAHSSCGKADPAVKDAKKRGKTKNGHTHKNGHTQKKKSKGANKDSD